MAHPPGGPIAYLHHLTGHQPSGPPSSGSLPRIRCPRIGVKSTCGWVAGRRLERYRTRVFGHATTRPRPAFRPRPCDGRLAPSRTLLQDAPGNGAEMTPLPARRRAVPGVVLGRRMPTFATGSSVTSSLTLGATLSADVFGRKGSVERWGWRARSGRRPGRQAVIGLAWTFRSMGVDDHAELLLLTQRRRHGAVARGTSLFRYACRERVEREAGGRLEGVLSSRVER